MKKIQNTNKKRYGNKCSLNGKKQKQMKKETWKKNFGKTNPFQKEESIEKCRKNKKKIYFYDNQYFDSSWELAFYIYYKDLGKPITRQTKNIIYYIGKEPYNYYPDFQIGRKLYEIKGEQFIKRYKNGNIKTFTDLYGNETQHTKARFKCVKENNIVIITMYEIQPYLDYINNNYGKDYLIQFRNDYKEKSNEK